MPGVVVVPGVVGVSEPVVGFVVEGVVSFVVESLVVEGVVGVVGEVPWIELPSVASPFSSTGAGSAGTGSGVGLSHPTAITKKPTSNKPTKLRISILLLNRATVKTGLYNPNKIVSSSIQG